MPLQRERGAWANKLHRGKWEYGAEAGAAHSIPEPAALPAPSADVPRGTSQCSQTLCATALSLPPPPLSPWRRFSWISADLTVSFNKQLKQTARAKRSCSLSLTQAVGRFEYWARDGRKHLCSGTRGCWSSSAGGGTPGLLRLWLLLLGAFPFPQTQWISG